MVSEISLALSSIKSAKEILKSLINQKTEVVVQEQAIELQNVILTLQSHINDLNSEYNNVVDEKKHLADELKKLKDWSAEKKNFRLAEIVPKVFVFVHKKYFDTKEDTYWLCAHCFESKMQKSIYQLKEDRGYNKLYYCPACKNEIIIKNEDYNLADQIKTSGRRFGSFIDRY